MIDPIPAALASTTGVPTSHLESASELIICAATVAGSTMSNNSLVPTLSGGHADHPPKVKVQAFGSLMTNAYDCTYLLEDLLFATGLLRGALSFRISHALL